MLPQLYEYILIEDITGHATNMIDINSWTQFFDLKGESEIKMSYAGNIKMRNMKLDCDVVFNLKKSDQYHLSAFMFDNLKINARKNAQIHNASIEHFTLDNVIINGKKL